MKPVLAAVSLFALLASAPAPKPAPAPGSPLARYPTASSSNIGATQVLFENDGASAVSGVQIFVAAGLDRERPNQSGVSALVAECLLRTPVDGVALKGAVTAAGGSISYTVDGRSVHYYLEGRTEELGSLVGLLARALAAPDFSVPALAAARASLVVRQTEFEKNALSVGIQMFRQSYYATGAGFPALGNAASSASLSSADVEHFFRSTYVRGAVMATVVGLETSELSKSLAKVVSALGDGAVASVVERANPISAEAKRIVAHREISAPWIVVGYAAPAPSSNDFGGMLVLESLLSDAFARASTTNLGFVERPIGAAYLYDSSPASLVVYVNGAQVDPSLALREVLVISESLAKRPLDAAQLRRFKADAEGQFISDSVNLSDRAYLLGTFASQGLGTDSINAALSSLERTNAADVQRVAKTYLQHYIVALVLPRMSQSPQ